MKPGEENIKD